MKKRRKLHKSLELGEMKEVVEFYCLISADGDSEAIQKEEICLKSHNEFVAELSLKSLFPGIQFTDLSVESHGFPLVFTLYMSEYNG